MYGAQADGQAEMNLGRNGAQLSAEARAGVYASGGAQGSLGAGVTGTTTSTAGTFAFARADNQYTYKDGKIVAKIDEAFGVGASAGTTGGISGAAGSLDAGITVYSPGVVGGTFNWGAGYRDGTISVELDLGIKALLGGLELNLGFSINMDEAAYGVASSDIGRVTAAFFGMGYDLRPRKPQPYGAVAGGDAMQKDPAARYAYLTANSEWKDYRSNMVDANSDFDAAFARNKAFYDGYTQLLKDTVDLVKAQNDAQKQFMALLQTNPQGAIDMAHSNVFKQLRIRQTQLQSAGWGLGVKLAVVDGKPVYVNQ